MIVVNPSLDSLLRMTILFVFFLEIILTLRIYRSHRNNHKTMSSQNPSLLVIVSPPKLAQNTHRDQLTSDFTPQDTKLILTNSLALSTIRRNYRLNFRICLGSIFILTFLLINYSFHPVNFAWTLLFLPILIPLPFLVLPALFQFKPYTTYASLLGGISLGAITLLFLFC